MSINVGQQDLPRQTLQDALLPAPRWLVSVGVAVLVSVGIWALQGSALSFRRELAFLAGWDTGILTYLVLTSLAFGRAGSSEGSHQAQPAAPARPLALAGVIVVSLLGFVAALGLAGRVGQPRSAGQAILVGLAMVAIVESWLLVRAESRLYVARLRSQRDRAGSTAPAKVATTRPEMLVREDVGFWEFMYYAFPTIGFDRPSDPALVTPAICKVAVLYSIMMYAALVILISFAMSLLGPGLNSARIILGG